MSDQYNKLHKATASEAPMVYKDFHGNPLAQGNRVHIHRYKGTGPVYGVVKSFTSYSPELGRVETVQVDRGDEGVDWYSPEDLIVMEETTTSADIAFAPQMGFRDPTQKELKQIGFPRYKRNNPVKEAVALREVSIFQAPNVADTLSRLGVTREELNVHWKDYKDWIRQEHLWPSIYNVRTYGTLRNLKPRIVAALQWQLRTNKSQVQEASIFQPPSKDDPRFVAGQRNELIAANLAKRLAGYGVVDVVFEDGELYIDFEPHSDPTHWVGEYSGVHGIVKRVLGSEVGSDFISMADPHEKMVYKVRESAVEAKDFVKSLKNQIIKALKDLVSKSKLHVTDFTVAFPRYNDATPATVLLDFISIADGLGRLYNRLPNDIGELELIKNSLLGHRPLNVYEAFRGFDRLYGCRLASSQEGVRLVYECGLNLAYQESETLLINDMDIVGEIRTQIKSVRIADRLLFPVGGLFESGVFKQIKSIIAAGVEPAKTKTGGKK